MILKVRSKLDNEKFEWIIIGNVDEIRIDYRNYVKDKQEPTKIKYRLIDHKEYNEIDSKYGAYLMSDDGKTIECIEVLKAMY